VMPGVRKQVYLSGGTLDIGVTAGDTDIDRLCGYASRENRKRRFLFVSKVLGKHWPVRPSVMRDVYQLLASHLTDLPGPILFIGMAETATGLGQGIYDALLRQTGRDDVLFIHTTRYHTSRQAAFDFQEIHSHATDHLLYLPETELGKTIFASARSVVISDDEISTGTTILNLLNQYRKINGGIKEARLASLTNWLGDLRKQELTQALHPIKLKFADILQGNFTFTANESFEISNEVDVRGGVGNKDRFFPINWGRFGVTGIPAIDFNCFTDACAFSRKDRILILGSGEFTYPPFLFAEHLEKEGHDVFFQSTTRSPILRGNDISSIIRFTDNYGDGIPNFVYNVRREDYSRIVVCYEHSELPPEHTLPQILDALPLFFAWTCNETIPVSRP